MDVVEGDAAGVAAAVEALGSGRLVIHATETVASLSGDPYSPQAIDAALVLKGYTEPRPLLCLVCDTEQARDLAAEWPACAQSLTTAFWPGPLTLVLAAGDDAPVGVAGHGTIALRWSGHEVTEALLGGWRRPVFSTSANPRAEPSQADPVEAFRTLADRRGSQAIGIVIRSPRETGGGARPSTIVDVTSPRPRLLRRGAVSAERLAAVVPDLEV